MSDVASPNAPDERSSLPPFVAAAAAQAADELPRRAADAVQRLVDTVHDKAVRPAVVVARALVFGLLIFAGTTMLAVLGSVALLRLFDDYFFSTRQWISYLVLGGLFSLIGLGAWSRRTARAQAA